MWFRVLGPLEVVDAARRVVDLGGRQPRLLLAMLLAAGGRPVAADALADAIWGDEPPASAAGTLQSYVSRLRGRFRGSDASLVWDDAGYRLDVDPGHVDFRRFERLADEGHALLEAGHPQDARRVLDEAMGLWRGPALAEFADLEFAVGLAARLEERRLTALEDRMRAELETGRHAAVVGELAELVSAHPFRERFRELLALALYRSGRQAEALRALDDARRVLRDELGIEPSRPLRDLETAILNHDPALDAVTAQPAAPAAAPTAAAPAPAGAAPVAPAGAAPVAPAGAAPAAPAPAGAVAPPAPSLAAPAPPAGAPALVGRDREVGELVAALGESAGDYRFVVVEGEPGIGKTRLVDELRAAAEARGALAVWGRSDEGGAAPALWPWLAPLRALAARAGGVAGPLAGVLSGEAPAEAGLASEIQFERFEAIGALIDRVAAAAPVVVMLDDLQWADDTSLELLAFLAGRAGRGLLLVGTVRQLEVGRHDAVTDALAAVARRPGSRRLQLRGLSASDTATLLAATTAQPVAADVVADIHARAEGNPFYAIELARLLREEGVPGDVPGSVADVIRRRLAHLPPHAHDLLGVAAVVGRDVELGLLARAAGLELDGCFDAVEPAVVHRLLVAVPGQPSVLRFSHALVREALLDDLSALRRARLHLRVADAIEAAGAGVDDAEILAEHLFQAAPVGGGRRAAEALERAAEVAVRRVAYGAAEDLLQRAVQLRRVTATSAPGDQEAELASVRRLIEIARARRYYAGVVELDRAKELAERCGERGVLLDVLWLEFSVAATGCQIELAGRRARQLLELAEHDPDPVRAAKVIQAWGVYCWQAGRITESLASLERARQLRASCDDGDVSDLANEQRMLGSTFWLFMAAMTGELSGDEVLARFDGLAAEQPDRFTVASALGFAATTAAAIGRWADVERICAWGDEVDPGGQFGFWASQRLMLHGVARAWRGKIDEALAALDEGRAGYTGLGSRSAVALYEACVAMHAAQAGRVDDAADVAAEARRELETYGERWTEPMVLMGESAVAEAQGDAETAARLLARAVEVADEQGSRVVADRVRALADDLASRRV